MGASRQVYSAWGMGTPLSRVVPPPSLLISPGTLSSFVFPSLCTPPTRENREDPLPPLSPVEYLEASLLSGHSAGPGGCP